MLWGLICLMPDPQPEDFSIYVVTDFLAELPVVLKYSLFVIYFIHSGVYIYVNPQLTIPTHDPICHLVTIS